MTEYDIDKQIKNFWGKRGIAQSILVMAESKGFSNATRDNPVSGVPPLAGSELFRGFAEWVIQQRACIPSCCNA